MTRSRGDVLFAFDAQEAEKVKGFIAGIDEAGRGPLAGPVVAAAVIFPQPFPSISVDDSKKLSAKVRVQLFREIAVKGLIGVGIVDEGMIDRINIYQATRVAMKKAVLGLSRTPEMLLIDGKMTVDLPIRQKAIVQGDAKSASIAAASIVAKVCRDAWMEHLDRLYPQYRFGQHKGYGTSAHLDLLRQWGPSPVHRRSFSPVRGIEGLSLWSD